MPEIVTELQQQQQGEGDAETPAEKKEPTKSVVGIIYPPPEVRNIVDKTADFVARNGVEFEERIKLNEAGNNKFNFLTHTDPYHAYYRHKIKEIQEGVSQESSQQTPGSKQAPVTMVTEPEVPREPPPPWEFMIDPPSVYRRQLDIIKLTAQFVARNGAGFMDQLMMKEQKNETFDFLRKNHILFTYFTKLVEQYSKILLPPRELTEKLIGDIENPLRIMDDVQKRLVWTTFREKEKKKAEEKAEKERVEYAQIDWHDFVIVETINFNENEAGYLPPPIQPSQLAARLLQQQKYQRYQDDGAEVEEIEMEVEDQEEAPRSPPRPAPVAAATPSAPPTSTGIQIRRDYNPKAKTQQPAQSTGKQVFISPVTGEKVSADKLPQHMRHALLDPRWIEEHQRQTQEKMEQEVVFAEGVQVGSSLKHLAERRTDIFGVEETVIGLKIGEEAQSVPTVQWDGHAGSAGTVRQQAQSKVTVQEQIQHIQRMQGLLVDPEVEKIGPHGQRPSQPPSSLLPTPPPLPEPLIRQARPPPPPVHPPQPPAAPPAGFRPPLPQFARPLLPTPPIPGLMHALPLHPAPPVEPPFAKRPAPGADENFIPEDAFISINPGPVTFKVQVPNVPDRPEWKLGGQVLTFTLPITDPVSVIKAKVNDELGMPTGKQKLQMGATFIKDSCSLGYYNFSPSTVVLLGLKERGGRKK